MTSLQSYLCSVKSYAVQAKLVVLGNEAADLDSMASSIAYGYLRSRHDVDQVVLPVMPIPRGDFMLRPEAVYVFHEAGIRLEDLVFFDEIDLEKLFAAGAALMLVDHNRLNPQWAGFAEHVVGLLDHHTDEGLFPDASPRVIRPVGSTASLVALEFVRADVEVSREMAILLGGALLLDTVNLDPDAGRVTETDLAVAAKILPLTLKSQQEFFAILHREKCNVAGLSTPDLLRKDYKGFQLGTVQCGISSVLLPVMDWLARDSNLFSGFSFFARARNLDVLLSMHGFANPDFRRELIMFCRTRKEHDTLVDFLQEKGLDLTSIPSPEPVQGGDGFWGLYRQGNLAISRKKLQPLLAQYYRRRKGGGNGHLD